MFANILTNVSVGLQKGRLDWGNDWGAQWIQKTNLQRWKSCAVSGLRLPKKEMEYWLAEAEEWKQLRESPDYRLESVKALPKAASKARASRSSGVSASPMSVLDRNWENIASG
jgi:hypothetical protein